ncbi:Ras-like GTP-binding protein RHO1 [Entamoeba marina]
MEVDLVSFFNNIANSNEWPKFLENQDIKEKAEALHEVICNYSDANPNSGKIENGKKAIKIVVVGDGSVGKTCLLLAYSRGDIPTSYVPTVFENFSHVIHYKNEDYILHLWDTAGQEEYDRLRPLSYSDSDVVLLCFAVNNRTSFENITSKWEPEIKMYIATAKTILVGLKIDLREDGKDHVSKQEGDELAKQLGCVSYLESSSVKKIGLAPVFEQSVDCIFNKQPTSSGTTSKNTNPSKKKDKTTCYLF